MTMEVNVHVDCFFGGSCPDFHAGRTRSTITRGPAPQGQCEGAGLGGGGARNKGRPVWKAMRSRRFFPAGWQNP